MCCIGHVPQIQVLLGLKGTTWDESIGIRVLQVRMANSSGLLDTPLVNTSSGFLVVAERGSDKQLLKNLDFFRES